jgi:hypothetical protein
MLQAYFQPLYKPSALAKIYKETHSITTSFLNHRREVSSSRLRVGSSLLEEGGTVHDAARIIEHPLYDWWSYDNDIAVVKVSDSAVRVSDSALLRLGSSRKYL